MSAKVKPGYKQTEVGVIPEDWSLDYIENLAHITTGGKNTQDRVEDGQYPFFVRSQTVERINTFSYDGEAVLTAGDGVGTGKVFHYIKGKFDAHQRVYRISEFNERINGYFFYLYFSNSFFNRIMQMTAKSSVDSVRREMIAKMPIPIPPSKAEQEAIVEALSDADALIEALEQLLAKKRHVKQGAMQELLTGKKRLPGFSGRWKEKTVGEIFDYHSTATNARGDLSPEGNTYYLHYGDIHTRFHGHLDFSHEQLPKIDRDRCKNATLLQNGDWIIVDASEDFDGIAKAVEVCGLRDGIAAIAGLHTFLLREKVPTFAPGFKGHLRSLKSLHEQLLRVATGMKVFGVSKTALKDIRLPIPTPEEQIAIAAVLSDMDAEIAVLESKLAKARQLKQGMMQELLTGRIRLTSEASKVIPFPQAEQAETKKRSHNWAINEAVVISVLAKHFGSEQWPLGRKRYTKLSYLLHRHVEHQVEGYRKKAAGPYNPDTKYGGPEKIAQQNGYLRKHHNGTYEAFVAGDKIAKAEAYFQDWYGEDKIQWLGQFRFKKNDELELLATVDMAMEDIRRAGKMVGLDQVKQIIRGHPEWKAKLDRDIFSDMNILRAISTCQSLFP